MIKKIVHTDQAPAAIGPYNQAVIHGDTVYTSGQIAINPTTGDLVLDNIAAETKQVIENIKAVLEASGSALDQVLMCQIFVKNMDDYQTINEVYAQYFDAKNAPARALVEVSNLPKYVNIEMCVTAALT